MAVLLRLYDKFVNGLAFVSGVLLVWLMLAVVASVIVRNMGGQPPAWLFSSTEYSLFYLTLLGAPWLIREKGHVFVEVFISRLPAIMLSVVSRLVMLICALICLVLAWKGLELVLSNIQGNDYDVRTYFIPMWIFTITYPVSFTLMALEFSRYLFTDQLFHCEHGGEI